MRVRMLAGLIAMLGFVPLLSADDHPFKSVREGDWIEYKMTSKLLPQAMMTKQTVSSKTDKEVTIRVESTMGGAKQPPEETKIDLTKEFDPIKMLQGKDSPVSGEFKKGNKGKDKVKVGGKDYDANWTEAELIADAMGQKVNTKIKIWQAKDAPMGGIVKMDMTMTIKDQTFEMNMELTGSGSLPAKK